MKKVRFLRWQEQTWMLLEHVMKGIERNVERLITERVNIDNMQVGFMPGRGTTDAIFLVKQLQEKSLDKKNKLYFAFVDLEVFERVPQDVV